MRSAAKLFLLLTALLFCLPATGQKKDSFFSDLSDFLDMREDKAYAKLDSNYIGRYPYHWNVWTFANTSGMHLTSTFDDATELLCGPVNRVGVGVSYRGVGFTYSHRLGKRRNTEITFSSYSKHFCFEYVLRATSDLKGDVADNLVLFSSNLNLFYSFNSRFSYAAAMKQSEIQRRSAGSLIAAVSWSVWDMLFLDPENRITSFYEQNYFYQRFSIGAGYGYNWVLGRQHWLFHLSLVPSWTVYEMRALRWESDRELKNYPYGYITCMGTARAGIHFLWAKRWSLGLSGVTNQMLSANRFSSKKPDFQYFWGQEWQANLTLTFRF